MLIDYYAAMWYCQLHDNDYTAEGICDACYDEMQYGDIRMSDAARMKHE